jgi:hypothetical protein
MLITLVEQLPENDYVPQHGEKLKEPTPEQTEADDKLMKMLISAI